MSQLVLTKGVSFSTIPLKKKGKKTSVLSADTRLVALGTVKYSRFDKNPESRFGSDFHCSTDYRGRIAPNVAEALRKLKFHLNEFLQCFRDTLNFSIE